MMLWAVFATLTLVTALGLGFIVGAVFSMRRMKADLKTSLEATKPQVSVNFFKRDVPDPKSGDRVVGNVPAEVFESLDFRLVSWPPDMIRQMLEAGVIQIARSDRNQAMISEWPPQPE